MPPPFLEWESMLVDHRIRWESIAHQMPSINQCMHVAASFFCSVIHTWKCWKTDDEASTETETGCKEIYVQRKASLSSKQFNDITVIMWVRDDTTDSIHAYYKHPCMCGHHITDGQLLLAIHVNIIYVCIITCVDTHHACTTSPDGQLLLAIHVHIIYVCIITTITTW